VFEDKRRGGYRGKVTIEGRTFTVYDRTKTGARTKLNEVIRNGGAKPAPSPTTGPTIDEVLDDFLDRALPSKSDVRAPSTVELHRWAARHIRRQLGYRKAEAVRVREVDDMLDALADEGLSRSALLKVRNTLSQSLAYAVKREDITRNVARDATIPPSAARTRERIALSPTDARTLLETLRGERNGAMFAMSLRLGLRPGEAAGLFWDDIGADAVNVTRAVQLTKGKASISDELKTVKSKRTIGLPADLADHLAEHRTAQVAERLAAESWIDERLVFTTPTGNITDPSRNRRDLAAICERAGVPVVTPNELRHSCTSLLADLGVAHEELADLLGHTTTEMVEQTYRHRLRPVVDVARRVDWTTSA
jgi:integrase